jgi:hypothetical protein
MMTSRLFCALYQYVHEYVQEIFSEFPDSAKEATVYFPAGSCSGSGSVGAFHR